MKVRQNVEAPAPERIVDDLTHFGRELSRCEGTVAKKRAEFLAGIVRIAHRVKSDPDAWAALCRAKYWDTRARGRPNVGQVTKPLLRCFQLAMNATEKTQLVAATQYAKALAPFLERGEVDLELEKKIVKAGGIDGLLEEVKQQQRRSSIVFAIDPKKHDVFQTAVDSFEDGDKVTVRCVVKKNDDTAWLKIIASPQSGSVPKPAKGA